MRRTLLLGVLAWFVVGCGGSTNQPAIAPEKPKLENPEATAPKGLEKKK